MGIFDRKATPPKTFADALMGDLSFIGEETETTAPLELTEKALVLESFTQFAHEKLEEEATSELRFEGGEIVRKDSADQMPLKPRFPNRKAWESFQAQRLGEAWSVLSAGKNPQPLILFVGESLSIDPEAHGEKGEFALCFAPGVAELFQKMVQAMKLTHGEYVLTTLKTLTEEKTADELFEEAHWWRPRFVVPLGAQACQALLGSRERLASIHGKSYFVPRLPAGAEIVPLFHPGVIATNANMKRATWTDMQKLMKTLGKD